MTTPLSSFRDAVYRYLAGFCTCRPDRVVTCFSISCGGTLSGGDGTGMTSTGVSSGFLIVVINLLNSFRDVD